METVRPWLEFDTSRAGRRFEQRYLAQRLRPQGRARRWIGLGGGVTLFTIGLIMVPAPAPGLPMVVLGAGMIAERSLWAARMFDRCELALRNAVRRVKTQC